MMLRSFFLVLTISLFSNALVSAMPKASLNVRLITDEAEAVLAVLQKRSEGKEITLDDWSSIFQSEAYVRLKKRELSMSRPFEDAAFREFVMSDDLLKRRDDLAVTLEKWKTIGPTSAGNRALAYLHRDASIAAKIYPVIKPQENSFVFEVKTDPAIFLYLDPAVDADMFENTLAQELHHISFVGGCPAPDVKAARENLPDSVRNALKWTRAFDEGLAMLAAAGAPNIHPYAVSGAKERAEWDAGMLNLNTDMKKVERFLLDVAERRLSGEEVNRAGFAFFGDQGPWYTVGWKMAAVIETVYGREKLFESFCDKSRLLKTYNSAAKKYERKRDEKLARWSTDLLQHFDKVD